MATYYRITTERAAAKLLDPTTWKSRVWAGYKATDCKADGCYRGTLADGMRCDVCRGTGEVEDVRHGVSACESVEDLAAYFAGRHATLEASAVLVEMEADMSEDDDHDAGEDGDPVLVLPTRIVAVGPVPQEIADAIASRED